MLRILEPGKLHLTHHGKPSALQAKVKTCSILSQERVIKVLTTHDLLQAEAALGEFSVTEAFLQLTLSLLQSGLHTASLQVLRCLLSTT